MSKVTTVITHGELTEGSRVHGFTHSKGRVLSFWEGTFDGIRIDTHDGKEDYAYFVNGIIGETPQRTFGFPVAQIVLGETAGR